MLAKSAGLLMGLSDASHVYSDPEKPYKTDKRRKGDELIHATKQVFGASNLRSEAVCARTIQVEVVRRKRTAIAQPGAAAAKISRRFEQVSTKNRRTQKSCCIKRAAYKHSNAPLPPQEEGDA